MSARPFEMFPMFLLTVPMLLLTSCQPGFGKYYSSLTDAWADQTLESAGPSITAALMIAGLTSELCSKQIDWNNQTAGEPPPLSEVLLEAMGEPLIDSIDIQEDLTEIYLREVRIMDRDEASIRIVPSTGVNSYSLTAEVQDGRDGETFGSLTFTISDPCDGSSRWVTGNAKWTDLTGVLHTITIPADDTDIGLKFDCAYAPNDGTLQWSGEIEGQTRLFSSSEAAEIDWFYNSTTANVDTAGGQVDCVRFDGVSAIEWSGTVVGGQEDWSTSTAVDIFHAQVE
ncbi:MAG: hypothetical protein ACI8RZ_001984 [Myxococcota bacterium]|jgi:hypothetical protein